MNHEDAVVELVCLCILLFFPLCLFCSVALSLFLFPGVGMFVVCVLTNGNKILKKSSN